MNPSAHLARVVCFSTDGDIPSGRCSIVAWGFDYPSDLCSYNCDSCFSGEGDIVSGKCNIIMPLHQCIYRIAQ